MSYKFFHIPAMNPELPEAEFNRFVASHRVLGIEREFVQNGASSAWVFAVEFVDGTAPPTTVGGAPGRPKVDYQAVLDPADFVVYSALRAKRKELADREAVPAYAIITNEQMAKVAELRATSLEELRRVEGLGDARITKYGRELLDAARVAMPATATRAAEGLARHEDMAGTGALAPAAPDRPERKEPL